MGEFELSREETEEIDAKVGRIHSQFAAIENEMTELLERVKELEHQIELQNVKRKGITREQAEQSFHERYYSFPDPSHNPEIRNLQMEEVDLSGMEQFYETIGPIDLTEKVWRCTFEIRRKDLNLGQWTGQWNEWRKDECYVVEAKPGPYVVDDVF